MREIRVFAILLGICIITVTTLVFLGVAESMIGFILLGIIFGGFPMLRALDYWITER